MESNNTKKRKKTKRQIAAQKRKTRREGRGTIDINAERLARLMFLEGKSYTEMAHKLKSEFDLEYVKSTMWRWAHVKHGKDNITWAEEKRRAELKGVAKKKEAEAVRRELKEKKKN